MPRTLEPGQLEYCRQCKGDLIGMPGEERCGTCGLLRSAPYLLSDLEAAKPEVAKPLARAAQPQKVKLHVPGR